MIDKLKKILLGVAALAALGFGGSALAGAASGGNDNAAPQGKEAEGPERNEAAEGKQAENAADTDNVQDENGKDDAGEASESGDKGEESDKPLTGDVAIRAKQAALAETGGGKAGDAEAEQESGASYAVEVTKTDGSKVDVHLDDQYKVTAVDKDDEQSGEQDDGADSADAGARKEGAAAKP